MARNKSNFFKAMDNLKSGVKMIEDTVYGISENIVDTSLSNGTKWQKIMGKAVDAGIGLFGKQQDLVINTLEELKGQYAYSNKRFRKLVDFGMPKPKKAAKPAKTAKKITVKAASAKSDVKKDDLKTINGIGPKIETFLNAAGFKTFIQLAKAKVEDLQKVLDTAGSRFRTHDPSTWVDQAKEIIKK